MSSSPLEANMLMDGLRCVIGEMVLASAGMAYDEYIKCPPPPLELLESSRRKRLMLMGDAFTAGTE